MPSERIEPLFDSRRWPLAGYLSALPEFSDRHPETLLPLADRIIAYLAALADPDPLDPAAVDAIYREFRDATGKPPHDLRPPPWWRRFWQRITLQA